MTKTDWLWTWKEEIDKAEQAYWDGEREKAARHEVRAADALRRYEAAR